LSQHSEGRAQSGDADFRKTIQKHWLSIQQFAGDGDCSILSSTTNQKATQIETPFQWH
jgi:hypothetical protein